MESTEKNLDDFVRMPFSWDPNRTCKHLELSEWEKVASSSTSNYSFKTTLGSFPFTPGFKYYFEVKMLKGNNFKIGVAKEDCDLTIAFSDTPKGWAYYSSGYLRHNSGGDGPQYGEAYTANDTVGVYVDLVNGELFFSKNGKVFGTAYKNEEFLKNELYPACCCLTKGESFELLSPMPED